MSINVMRLNPSCSKEGAAEIEERKNVITEKFVSFLYYSWNGVTVKSFKVKIVYAVSTNERNDVTYTYGSINDLKNIYEQ